MKKIYQVGAHAPVRTYKEALRQHAKFTDIKIWTIWKQPIGCVVKYGVDDWRFKYLIKHGKWIGWKGMKELGDF